MVRSFLIAVLLISLVGCGLRNPFVKPKHIVTTENSIRYVVALLPQEFQYLLPKNGDTMDDMDRKLRAAIDQLLKTQASIQQTNQRVDQIIKEINRFN